MFIYVYFHCWMYQKSVPYHFFGNLSQVRLPFKSWYIMVSELAYCPQRKFEHSVLEGGSTWAMQTSPPMSVLLKRNNELIRWRIWKGGGLLERIVCCLYPCENDWHVWTFRFLPNLRWELHFARLPTVAQQYGTKRVELDSLLDTIGLQRIYTVHSVQGNNKETFLNTQSKHN